jgi:hypothetical protein
MIKLYRTASKTKLLLRVIAGVCLMIGLIFFALSAPFLVISIGFFTFAYGFLIICID